MTQDEILAIIKSFPGIRQIDISDHTVLGVSTISKQCRKLKRNNRAYPEYVKKSWKWYPV